VFDGRKIEGRERPHCRAQGDDGGRDMKFDRRQMLAATGGVLASLTLPDALFAQQSGRKILIIVSNQDIPNFDPHIATGYSASMMMRNVYDSLVRAEGNPPKPVPHLAASWTVSDDGLEYVFKLDPAAKFQDGAPVTAEDVAYSFARLIRLNRG